MARVLVIYSSRHGQTAKIASTIGRELKKYGLHAHVLDVTQVPNWLGPEGYQAVVIGAPVYMGKFPNELLNWVKRHASTLNKRPTSFFSVCLGILQPEGKVQSQERKIVERFFKKCRWRPTSWDIFAGALMYSSYGWFTKRVIRWIAGRAGGQTDMSRDWEYTDWTQVSQFAQRIADNFAQTKSAQDKMSHVEVSEAK